MPMLWLNGISARFYSNLKMRTEQKWNQTRKKHQNENKRKSHTFCMRKFLDVNKQSCNGDSTIKEQNHVFDALDKEENISKNKNTLCKIIYIYMYLMSGIKCGQLYIDVWHGYSNSNIRHFSLAFDDAFTHSRSHFIALSNSRLSSIY